MMKKLLSILGSLIITASSASAVSACSSSTKNNNGNNNSSDQSSPIVKESIDSLKPYVLADAFGTDLTKTQSTIKLDKNFTKTPDIVSPTNDAFNGLNLNGTTGRDNMPLYSLNDTLNKILKVFGVAPIDLSPYIQNWGMLLKTLPNYFSQGNIDAIISLIPTVMKYVANLIPQLPIDGGTVTWLGTLIKNNIKYIMKDLDFNGIIVKMIDDAQKANKTLYMPDINKAGADALLDLGNTLLGSYYPVGAGDNSLSSFLGTEILTPLLNNPKQEDGGPKIDVNKIKKIFTNPITYAPIHKIITDASTLLASVFFQLSYFYTKFDDTPADVSHLLSDNQTYDALDQLQLSETNGDIKVGNNEATISLNRVLFKTMDLLTADQSTFGIFKITTALFHNDGNTPNALLDKIAYLLLDALKFTDFTIPEFTFSKDIVVASVTVASVTVDIKDLTFKKLTTPTTGDGINLGNVKPLIGSAANINLNVQDTGNGNVGLIGLSDSVEKILYNILSGDDTNLKNACSDLVSNLFLKTNSIYLTFGDLKGNVLSAITYGLFPLIWGKVQDIVSGLLNTVWYTDGTNLYNALKNDLGLKDDAIAKIKKAIGGTFPLSQKITSLISNTPIGDLRNYEGVINIDVLLKVLDILLLENPIQDPSLPQDTDDNGKPVPLSLIEQILISMNNNATRGTVWNNIFGYVDPTNIGTSDDPTSHYIQEDSFVGQLVEGLYPTLMTDKDNANIKGLFGTTKDTNKPTIGLRFLNDVHSDVMDSVGQLVSQFQRSLAGADIKGIIFPAYESESAWSIKNLTMNYFSNTQDINSFSYDLSFSSKGLNIMFNGKSLNTVSSTYKVVLSRLDNNSLFSIVKVQKIN